MTIRWKINGEREVKGMKVIDTIEVTCMGKRVLIDIVEGDTKGGFFNKRMYVGMDFLKENYMTEGLIKEMKECA